MRYTTIFSDGFIKPPGTVDTGSYHRCRDTAVNQRIPVNKSCQRHLFHVIVASRWWLTIGSIANMSLVSYSLLLLNPRKTIENHRFSLVFDGFSIGFFALLSSWGLWAYGPREQGDRCASRLWSATKWWTRYGEEWLMFWLVVSPCHRSVRGARPTHQHVLCWQARREDSIESS